MVRWNALGTLVAVNLVLGGFLKQKYDPIFHSPSKDTILQVYLTAPLQY